MSTIVIDHTWKVLDTWYADSKSNGIGNANYILINTTSWAHKKLFVTIAIILYELSINQKFLKLEHPTVFWTKNNMFNMLLAHWYLFTLLAFNFNAVKLQ